MSSGATILNASGAETNAKPASAPSHTPSAGISIAARTRSRRPEGRFLITCAFPRRRPLDPLAFITALAQDAGALLCEPLDEPREVAEKRPHHLVNDADRVSQ